ncbi:MAG TPA: response regulator [Candidatus Paceibacterota bacterium]|nr:response regulator [Candidatus Paceibacterota bacterium]
MTTLLNKKILVTEDEAPLRNAVSDILNFEGFTVFQAKNGQEGLEIALREHPDLILLDLIMPVMDGLTMLEKLREDEWGKTAAVILLTNINDPEKVAQATEAGTYDFLVKSDWNIEDVVGKIKTRLGITTAS